MNRLFRLFISLMLLAGTVTLHGQVSGGGSGNSGNATSISSLAVCNLTDPNADRILFWDDSAACYAHLTVGGGLSITGTTLSASGGAGTGTVVGPGTVTAHRLAAYADTTGDLLEQSVVLDTSGTLSGIVNLTVNTAGALRTATSAGNTLLIQARDVDGASYTTFATLTANNTPTFDLSAATTVASSLIATAAKDLSFFSSTTSAQLDTLISDDTGSGVLVFATSPTLVTPVLGVATATSVNGLTITTSTGTLTIANGKVVTVSNQLTFTGTDSSSVAFGAGGTVIYASSGISGFTAGGSTSAQLATVLSDETGSGGGAVFATSPTIAVPLFNGWREAYVAKTATYTVLTSDSILTCDSTGGAVTFDLPTAGLVAGRNYTFKKIDSSTNACTIDPSSTQTVDGVSTYVITIQWDSVTIYSNGANWEIKSNGGLGLSDPGADRIVFWDDSANHLDWLTVAGCSISGTTLTCSGAGDVTAASSFAADNAVIRADGTAKGVQSSGLIISDADALSGVASITMVTAGALRTTTTAAHTFLLQAYDTDTGPAYVTFLTCTAGTAPTCDFSTSTTLGGTALASSGSTNTFTNKTIDTSATGNVFIMPIFAPFSIAGCTAGTGGMAFNTQGSGAATITCNGSTVISPHISFADATTNEFQFALDLPPDWDSTATHTFTGRWRTSATSGDVKFQVSGVCMADAEVVPTAYSSTADTVTETAKGTTLQANDFTITLSTSANHALATCAVRERFYFRFFRDATDGADTLAAAAELISLNLVTGVSK